MQRGKSGGFRLLYKLENSTGEDYLAYLLFVYAKADQADVSLKALQDLMQAVDEATDE